MLKFISSDGFYSGAVKKVDAKKNTQELYDNWILVVQSHKQEFVVGKTAEKIISITELIQLIETHDKHWLKGHFVNETKSISNNIPREICSISINWETCGYGRVNI